jgi:uncharacterized membrane protein YozB (DUF420 family)
MPGVVALVPTAAGLIAFALGAVLVALWHLRTDLKPCFKRKLTMRVTIVTWIIALLLGFILYILFYGTLLI